MRRIRRPANDGAVGRLTCGDGLALPPIRGATLSCGSTWRARHPFSCPYVQLAAAAPYSCLPAARRRDATQSVGAAQEQQPKARAFPSTHVLPPSVSPRSTTRRRSDRAARRSLPIEVTIASRLHAYAGGIRSFSWMWVIELVRAIKLACYQLPIPRLCPPSVCFTDISACRRESVLHLHFIYAYRWHPSDLLRRIKPRPVPRVSVFAPPPSAVLPVRPPPSPHAAQPSWNEAGCA